MIIINGNNLNLNDFIKVVRNHERIALAEEAIDKINLCHQKINTIIENSKVIYGVNTGFGKLSDVLIPKTDLSLLQENLLKSHACGVGKSLSLPTLPSFILNHVV